jgi:pimeloyl-ACP methyl ester carboxylesterase
MRDRLRKAFRGLLVAIISTPLWHAHPAVAQSGQEPLLIKASVATKYSRYYAPYALQAAAAYIPVSSFDATLRPGGLPALNGTDVALAAGLYLPDQETTARAAKYLRVWQYQFGSDSYLTCIDPNDLKCEKEYNPTWGWRGFNPGGGPAFQVWARTHYPHADRDACSEVSISFRGTVSDRAADWISNFDPITGYVYDDYYYQLRRNVDAIIRKISSLDCYKRARHRPQIVSVGHSLGGGLAQFSGLAGDPNGPRIAKVFAFDSSPVTGSGIIKDIRARNAEKLEIDRIYQSGEVLSKYLALVGRNEFPLSSSTCKPLVRTVRYDAVPGSGSVGLHNMKELAGQIVELSYDNQVQQSYQTPPTTNCDTNYRAPTSNEDEMPAPIINPAEQTVYAPDGSARIAHHYEFAPSYRSAKRDVAVAGERMSLKGGRSTTVHSTRKVKQIRASLIHSRVLHAS